MLRWTHAIALVVVLGVCGTAAADVLMLKDGRFIDGVKMKREGEEIHLLYENGTVRVSLDRVEDYVIEGVPPFEPKTEEEKKKREEGLVPYRGRWVKPKIRERELKKRIDKKRAEIEEYKKRGGNDFDDYRTKHFLVKSSHIPRVSEEFVDLIEAYFKEFSKLWKVKIFKDWGKLPVHFYHNRDAFTRRSGAGGGTMAYYKFVHPREIHFFYDRTSPETTMAVMFHEMNHYLVDLMDEKFQYPHWVNEGMAEYYGGSIWDPEKRKLTTGGIQEGRLIEVLNDMETDKLYNLEDLISHEGRDYRHYYWGWSFIHFMLETPKYAKKFQKFISDLARARDVKRQPYSFGLTTVSGFESMRVFRSRLGVKDLFALENEWYEYIRKLPPPGMLGKEKAGLTAFYQGRTKFRAPRLLKDAIEAGSKKMIVYVQYARCLRMKDQDEEALKVIEKACEMDPLDPDGWAYRGYILSALGKNEEGEKYIALAKEMDPNRDYLWLEIEKKLREMEKGED